MNKPSKKVWQIIRNNRISEKDHSTLRKSKFINDLFKIQWNRDSLPQGSELEEPDFEKVWNKIVSESYEEPRASARTITLNILKYAAVALIAAASFWVGNTLNTGEKSALAEESSFFCPRGAKSEIRLPDNSIVWLNANSSIDYDENFGGQNRNIQLKGEAVFEVQKNEKLPFVVSVGTSKITALGTEFYISAYPFNSKLSAGLIEGSIQISTFEKNIILSEPQSVSIQKENGSIISEGELISSFYEWKNGRLVFENTPLSEMVHRLSNWFDYNVAVEREISDQKFTLTIEDEDIREVLELLEMASDIKYERTEDGYTILSN
jgi:ferric-dicitrate binding protein FerR (iron transport regulator)